MSKRVVLSDIELEYLTNCVDNHLTANTKNNNGGLYVIAKKNLEVLKAKLAPTNTTEDAEVPHDQ